MSNSDQAELAEKYRLLVSQGERYAQRATVGHRVIEKWRALVHAWLRSHASSGELDEILKKVPINNISLALKTLKRAERVVPVLNEHLSNSLERGGKAPKKFVARAFIVHGHDHLLRDTVAKFLKSLRIEPIILDEQPNEGNTILEKFLRKSRAHFAVVLLTPDDRGGTKKTPYKQQMPRARQNVILELGFFIGRLGRKKVVALCSGSIELPSDYHGVVYVSTANVSRWKAELKKELVAAKIIRG